MAISLRFKFMAAPTCAAIPYEADHLAEQAYYPTNAALSSPSFWGKKSRSFELLDGFPFGPGTNEFLAWYNTGGGKILSQNLYQRYNMHSLVCGITGPTFGGWFREPVNNIADLRKRRVAAVGLGAKVLSQAGVLTALIAPQDIRSAIQSARSANMPKGNIQKAIEKSKLMPGKDIGVMFEKTK